MSILRRLRNHPHMLEVAYKITENIFQQLNPLFRKIGYQRAGKILHMPEKLAKQAVFDCKMCGQCTLHFTGMTCPMTCPKNLRNGPCGGVRIDKTCEVKPNMKCVWVEAYERSTKMSIYGDGIFDIQPPRNHLLARKSAFINILSLQDAEIPNVWRTQTRMTHDRK